MDSKVFGAAALFLLLAGCSSGGSVTLEQSDLVLAKGRDSKTLECTDDPGKVTYSVSGTVGKLDIRVQGPGDTDIVDKSDVSGTSSGKMEDLRGASGTWILSVDRSDFSGSYTVELSC